MFCSNCGQARLESARFCNRCGTGFQSSAPAGPPLGAQPTQVLPAWSYAAPPVPPSPVPAPLLAPGAPRRRARGVAWGAGALALAVVAAGAVVLFRPRHEQATLAAAPASAAPAASPSPTSPAPSASPSLSSPSALYKSVSDGVIRIETTACDGGGVGSGFLVARDLVATVAHVVNGAVSVVLRQGGTATTGTVVGIDLPGEVALVRTAAPLTGHVFQVADALPDVGTDVAAIGYPLAGDESLTKGSISGQDRTIDTESGHHTGLLQTDAAINPGNSGGPLLGLDGLVYGLVEAKRNDAASIGYAVPTASAGTQLAQWEAAPTPVRPAGCGAPTGPAGIAATITDNSGSPDGPGLADAFSRYATGINTGDYESAYAVLSAQSQARVSASQFAQGEASSYLVDLNVQSVQQIAPGTDQVEVAFTSVQDAQQGHDGQTCSRWAMTYDMVEIDGGWLIDRAQPHPGTPTAC